MILFKKDNLKIFKTKILIQLLRNSKATSNSNEFDIWVLPGGHYSNIATFVDISSGAATWTDAPSDTGAATQPASSYALQKDWVLKIGGVDRLKVDSAGGVTIKDGDLVIGTGGHGIDFSAQTSTSASGAQVSGTGHEILTHYEEGQWTPAPNGTGQSYGWQTGRYTRIGNTVFYWFDVSWTGMSSGVADGRITGLPFTSTSLTTQGGYGAPSFRAATGLETDIRVYGNSSYVANDYIQLQHYQSSGAVALTDFLANGRVSGEGFYFTNNAY